MKISFCFALTAVLLGSAWAKTNPPHSRRAVQGKYVPPKPRQYPECKELCQVRAFVHLLTLTTSEWNSKYNSAGLTCAKTPMRPLGVDMEKAFGWGKASATKEILKANLITEISDMTELGKNAGTHPVYRSKKMSVFVKFMSAEDMSSWQSLQADYKIRMAAARDETLYTWKTLLPRILLVGEVTYGGYGGPTANYIAFTSAVPFGGKV